VKTVAGVFESRQDAQHVVRDLRMRGLGEDRLALMIPGNERERPRVPVISGEQPGMGKVLGGTAGAATGAAGGFELGALLSAALPGVGPVLVGGFLGATLLGAAGGVVGAAVGGKIENRFTEGLPEDELFFYEDALRQGRSVVVAVAADETSAKPIRTLMKEEGAESVDAAREKWWIGLRDVEREHYDTSGGDFHRDEMFYRLGFQAALHARTRGKEYDQVLNEMAQDVEDLKRRYPDSDVEEPFRKGYERGRAYFESIRSKK
jgi:hypothetical protein